MKRHDDLTDGKLHERLRERQAAMQVSYTEVAEALNEKLPGNTGVTYRSVRDWFVGDRVPRVGPVRRALAEVMECEPRWLFLGEAPSS